MWQKIKNIYHLAVAILANILYGFPGRKLVVIGVTGTDGKTTTVNLIYHILKQSGYPVSMISTVGAVIHGKTSDIGFHVTTPSSLKLQKFLSQIVKGKKEKQYLVLEVTSHALDQNRVWGIPFAVGVLTNITHEHLDYHKTYEKYVGAKSKLLKTAKVAILNPTDQSYPYLKKPLQNKVIKTYSLKGETEYTARMVPALFNQEYNTLNALAAVAACNEVGVPLQKSIKALRSFVFPKGRTEIVYKKDFTVMIDFAHTPNAFEQLLSSLKPQVKGQLIHVFGSAAKRDETKRPLMGKVASQYDDSVILTSEDPRNEDPKKIMAEIQKGMNTKKHVQVFQIINRKDAIEKAISLAKKGDFVLLTGKAHEKSMNMGKGEEVWDEFAAVKSALKKYAKA